MRGLDEDHQVEDVRFEDFELAGTPCQSTGEADLDILEYVGNVEFAHGASAPNLVQE
jgi:hypothetical protein